MYPFCSVLSGACNIFRHSQRSTIQSIRMAQAVQCMAANGTTGEESESVAARLDDELACTRPPLPQKKCDALYPMPVSHPTFPPLDGEHIGQGDNDRVTTLAREVAQGLAQSATTHRSLSIENINIQPAAAAGATDTFVQSDFDQLKFDESEEDALATEDWLNAAEMLLMEANAQNER